MNGGRLARLRGAPATSALLVVLVVVFLASWARPELLVRFVKDDDLIRAGEVWRLVTANFLHAGIAHLAVNGFALAAIGPAVEQLYGRAWFVAIFVVGGTFGFGASTLFVTRPSLGASAGLFALLGVLLGFPIRARERIRPAARRAMMREILVVAALNLALGLMVPFIDNAAHVGGFVTGVALGLLIPPRHLP